MQKILGLAFVLSCAALPVAADQIPDAAFDKYFENCVGADKNNPQKIAYCTCVRNGMKSWSSDDFIAVAMEQMKTGQPSPKLEALAKACAEKVLAQ